MNDFPCGRTEFFEAFIKSAQYIVRLQSQQDIWSHLGKLIMKYFPVGWTAIVRRDAANSISIRYWTPADETVARAVHAEKEVGTIVSDVLDSGFLATRVISAPAPSMTVFLPVVEQGRPGMVMLIGHKSDDPVSRELLDIYLAIAGLAGSTSERLNAEIELKRRRDHLEELVKERTAELEAANRELESFSYSVSHDLRSPLRAITGFTRMVLDENGPAFDPETRRKLSVIQENARKMGRLIDDLLRLSRLGRAGMNRSKLDMGDLVREVLREIRMAEPDREFAVEIGDLPAVEADRTMIRQLLANLLSNAVKFTRYKEDARIEAGSFEEAGERIYYVKDNGVGFDMKYYSKLFGVFQRLVSESRFEGTGVGLAIVQRIVQQHGGRVWAEGEIGDGAAFYFTLPPREQE